MSKQEVISVCSYCQEDFPEVKKAIQLAMEKYGFNGPIVFSHGYCIRHYVEMLKKSHVPYDKIKKSIKDLKAVGDDIVPDLKERPDLVATWSKGDFRKMNESALADKPIVRMCSWCQQINIPQFAEYAVGIDRKVLEEMKVVDKQVNDNKDNFTFTHGICLPHMAQMYKKMPGMTEDRIKLMLKKNKDSNPSECLLTNEPVRHAFMKGLFTPELVQQSAQSQQQSNQKLTERFKKLAGISV